MVQGKTGKIQIVVFRFFKSAAASRRQQYMMNRKKNPIDGGHFINK
jgi:hypothetical protein